ncbi:MAG: radical SAM protein [Chloroflexi bacterium]|nr:radical SAM protein [Chloroflexota bacterium]
MLHPELNQPENPALCWRISSGSAAVLGLLELHMESAPTTLYLMLGERCQRNCAYCAQASSSHADQGALSRIIWPEFPASDILTALPEAVVSSSIRRVCLQVTHNPAAMAQTLTALQTLRAASDVPVCCSITVDQLEQIETLLKAGADKVTLALDAATPAVYRATRGNDWAAACSLLEQAAMHFPGRISTHLIIGLGESEREAIERLQWFHECGIGAGLFAFTPVRGTRLQDTAPPALGHYRRLQTAFWLIYVKGFAPTNFRYDEAGRLRSFGLNSPELKAMLDGGQAFQTSGCRDCNRPYYNERPGGVLYNYPRPLSAQEWQTEWLQLCDELEFERD